MDSAGITIDKDNFKKIFPFYVRINEDLKIIDSGPSIRKILGEIEGQNFEDVFSFIRPKLSIRMEFESFCEHQDIVIILESKEFPIQIRFRGQFIFEKEKKEIIYLNSPWVTDTNDLGFLNLLISDFAIHDTITDNLQLIKSKQIVNEDMKNIADELIEQRDQLLEKNELIIELARFPDQDPQPIIRMDFEGSLLYVNSAAEQTIEELGVLDGKFWSGVYLKFEKNNFIPFQKEYKWGNKIYEVSFVPIRQKGYFNAYFREITETIKFQDELITANSRLFSLINSMQSAVLAEDNDRKILLVNQNFCDLFNVPLNPDQMVGLDCSRSAEEAKSLFKDEEGFVQTIHDILEKREPVFGTVLYMKNGAILERDYIPIFENHRYMGHIWKYQDITVIVKQKESLIKVEEKYRRIIEDLDFGLIEVDLNECITKVYPAFCKLTGYDEEELLGRNAKSLLAFDEDVEMLTEQNEERKKGVSSVYEVKIKTKSQDIKWVIISGTPIYNEKNEIIGSLGIHLDITDRKKLEQELMLANEKAYSSVRAKEMFLANISHEIRTPMNVIIGMTELMNDSKLGDEQLKYLSAIKNSADNLLNLINDILDFSKIEAGHLFIEETPTNLKVLIEQLELSFSDKAKEKGIIFLKNVDSEISENLCIDQLKLNQVLINLLSNALKFTPHGFVRISAELIERSETSEKIKFEVEDSGIGINEENFDSIFQTFIQEDSSISRKFGGTGLGLSISKSIIEKMGGAIELKSVKGKGSVFSFTLCFNRDFTKKPIELKKKNIDLSILRSLNVLIAEDNEMNQLLITSILTKEQIPFEIAINGEQAVAKLKEKKFDIVLMDIQMPKMDGVTATKIIRNTIDEQIPIIALTANASKEDELKYLRSGMNDHLSKPFKKEQLFHKMIRLVSENESNLDSIDRNDPKIDHSNQLYSLSHLNELAQGDDSFIRSILMTFQKNVPIYLKEISEGIIEKDFKRVTSAAHQLKPSIDIFEMTSIKDVVRFIEKESLKNDKDLAKLKDSSDILSRYLLSVLSAMQSHFEN